MGSIQRQRRLGGLLVNGALLLIVLLWTVPTIGLFVSSFRSREAIQSSGWWNILPHRAFVTVGDPLDPDEMGLDPTGPMAIGGGETTFEEMREGYRAPDGRYYVWIGNRRNGRIEVQEQKWTVDWDFTPVSYTHLDVYKRQVQIFFRIMVPYIMGTIITVSTTVVIFTLKIFDVVWVMTGGQFGTDVIATQFYRQSFTARNSGYGSAIAIVLLIAIVPVMIYNLRQFREQEAF